MHESPEANQGMHVCMFFCCLLINDVIVWWIRKSSLMNQVNVPCLETREKLKERKSKH